MPSSARSAAEPPRLLQVAGHPLRWSLLTALARSDRTVHELTEHVGEAQNLVSYHLGKLRDAGLVSARRSSADRRDAYYAVDLARFERELASVTGALHPGLRSAPGRRAPALAPARVLFLCTGNSARSQIAEALLRERSKGVLDVRSAGSHPKPLHPDAARVLRERLGVDPNRHEPKHLETLADEPFDWVISLCDKVREACPELPGRPAAAHWSIPDPSTHADADERWTAFSELTDELEGRVGFLLAAIAASTHRTEEHP